MTTSVVSLHPFAPVTVRVYVPGVVIFNSAIELTVVIPSDQLYLKADDVLVFAGVGSGWTYGAGVLRWH